ncbi:hypothetical protein [Microvirga flavescens]|uniref:hypothetical protein n=1 Tax=Microvirga flavescens TaxID=2249811 RepID=UPI000DD5DB71|nr:hypothetical protein [Microvirga flavescens]
MFTLEIAGKAIAVTNADEDQAQELFTSEGFKDDLVSFRSENKPLWDGSAALKVRRSLEDEIEAFDDILDSDEEFEEEEEEDEDGDDGIDVVFLVEIDEMGDDA